MGQRKQAEMHEDFKLEKSELDGKIILTISPVVACGYEPKAIEISQEQWDALQYHFAKKDFYNSADKRAGLAYVS